MESAPEMWAGKYKTTGHGSLIIGDEFGNIIFVSDPAPGCDHDMKKREGEVKEILDLAGSVIADKGFQGSGYVTPAKKPQHRELYTREHEYNKQVSLYPRSHRARGCASQDLEDPFHRLSTAAQHVS